MSRNMRKVLNIAVVTAAIGLSSAGWAADGVIGRLARETQDRNGEQRQERQQRSAPSRQESRPAPQPQPQSPPQVRSGPERPAQERGANVSQRSASSRDERGALGRLADRVEQRDQGRTAVNRNDNRNAGNRNGGDRGLTGSLVQREYRTNDNRPRDNNGNWDRDDRRNAWNDYDRRERERQWHRDHRPGRVIQRLPVGYRDYAWGGSRYYYYGGSWYQPYGGTYISVGIPYGLFVTTLPGAYDSFWYGGTRYYYSDYNYYTYEPVRRGYVVVESPYDDEEDPRRGQDLFIYPANGQSAQQQADDRYECHRWGVDQADYDPLDDEYDADLRADYLRAMTACLTGRGYTVK